MDLPPANADDRNGNAMKTAQLLLFGLLSTAALHADGGRIRLHQQAGPFIVTMFTTPDPLKEGLADFSVAVERADAPGLISDAEVTLLLSSEDNGKMDRISAQATHAAATSQFLQAANVTLPHAGEWRVRVLVSEGAETGDCATTITVDPAAPMGNESFWQILLIPIVVSLYILHCWRRARSRRAKILVQ